MSRALVVAAVLGFAGSSPVFGQVIGTTSTSGTIDYSIVGLGSIAGVAPGAIPQHPGSQILPPTPGPAGNFAAFAQTWDFSSSQVAAFIQNSPLTGFVTEVVQDAEGTPAAGLTTLSSAFTINYSIGAAGLPATTQSAAFGFGGLIGPAGGFAEFQAHINYSSSVLGPLGSIDLIFATAATGPISSGINGTRGLPVLPASSVLTVSGTFSLKVDDNPGDGLVTEFGVTTVPEPSSLALLGLSAATIAACGWRKRRRAST